MNNIILILPLILFAFIFIVLLHLISKWCINDATQRGKSPTWLFLAVIFFFPWGLIAWLIFRPNILEPHERPFNLSEHRKQ